jgi:hypothetical protein
MLTPFETQWVAHDGTEVWLHGYRHTLRVRSTEAIYPYAHTVLSVSAEPVNKTTRYYQDTRQKLGDDWSIDVLSSEDIAVPVMKQLGWTVDEAT